MDTAKRKRTEFIGLWLGLGILIVVGAMAWVTITRLTEASAWLRHTHQVIETLNELRATMTEAASARRAFTLSGDERQAAVVAREVEHVRSEESEIRRLVADNPEQQKRLDALEQVVEQRIISLNESLVRRRIDGHFVEQDAATVASELERSAKMRALLQGMISSENVLLADRDRASLDFARRTRLLQAGGTATSFALFLWLFVRLRRQIVRRIESERALRDSEESLNTTLLSIGDGVIATDTQGNVVRMNPIAERLTGWSMAEAAGRPFTTVFAILNEVTRAPAQNPIERVLREGIIVGLANHTVLISKEGTERPIADSAAPIHDATGQLTGVVLVFRDMSGENELNRRLMRNTAFLDSIIENLPNMIFVKDARELSFERFNKAGEELVGTERAKLIGKNDFDFFPKDQAELFQAKDRETLAGKVLVDIPEEPIDTPRGRRWLHTRKIPILDEDGVPQYLLGISEDITERKELSESLQRAHDQLARRVEERTTALVAVEEQLRQSQKMEAVGRLAGGIAHDFNNLLSVILSYSSLLGEDLPAGHAMRADLDEIRNAGERAADLTRQLLAFSRQQVLSPKVVDLNDVISGMEKLLRRVIGEDVDLRAITSMALGKVKVDPGQIEQVILNLVVNARDAMPSGGQVTIETANVTIDEAYAAEHVGVVPGPHIMLAVTDTGSGMDKQTQARIFEPFFTTKEKGKGTGLGLSTVFGIVQQSGGSIWFYSEIGEGTTFKIFLPRVADISDEAAPELIESVVAGSETILLVEDEDQVRAVARTVLKRSGYQVLEAQDAAEAILLCKRFFAPIHLILTDVVMPRMSGRQLVEALAPLRPEMKVLFMSGYTDDTVVRHGALDSGIAFLQKPIRPDTLARKVREVLDAKVIKAQSRA